ncbi:unnamed protein product [Vitrella brassicaformis CCMP3155]|uniref:DUF8019 domain-containing protein n=1 Tax=Vitrella brassicaformis (strain CCMP3155) TaxID=1169540 RepID=A0A0G4F4I3_VITBC|nr:unnamed protein product [Vitrella brassicaformis CCMP3155]|eukprot:CEM06961.1 unnamed protein product [Vitrella brassicaformis CCMP3155]
MLRVVVALAQLLLLVCRCSGVTSLAGVKRHADSQYPVCDVAINGSVCHSSGAGVLLSEARQYGRVAKYSFDSSGPLDSSGFANHGVNGDMILAAPSLFAGRSGAVFSVDDSPYLRVPHSPLLLHSSDFTIMGWFAIQQPRWLSRRHMYPPLCPLVLKGRLPTTHTGGNGKRVEMSPALMYNTTSLRLKVLLSTTSSGATAVETLDSNARLSLHVWTHLAVVRHSQRLRVYVDGLLDSTLLTVGLTRPNAEPLYIGGAPRTQTACRAPILVDELKVFNRSLSMAEVMAEGNAGVAGSEQGFVRLSCAHCTMAEGVRGCRNTAGYHFCTTRGLQSGALAVARQLGWYVTGKTAVLSQPNKETIQTPSSSEGLGLCCRDQMATQ